MTRAIQPEYVPAGLQGPCGIDPQPVCRGEAAWAASGAGGWYIVVPLADGGDASNRGLAPSHGTAAPLSGAIGTDVGGADVAAAEGLMSSATIDWAQVETYERGYQVSPC